MGLLSFQVTAVSLNSIDKLYLNCVHIVSNALVSKENGEHSNFTDNVFHENLDIAVKRQYFDICIKCILCKIFWQHSLKKLIFFIYTCIDAANVLTLLKKKYRQKNVWFFFC